MGRVIERAWRPVAAVLFGLALALLAAGVLVMYRDVRANARTIEALRDQVLALGGNPDAPPPVVTVRVTAQPAAPTRRETPAVVVVTAAPASPAPSSRAPAPTTSPRRPPSRPPTSSPTCVVIPVLRRCL